MKTSKTSNWDTMLMIVIKLSITLHAPRPIYSCARLHWPFPPGRGWHLLRQLRCNPRLCTSRARSSPFWETELPDGHATASSVERSAGSLQTPFQEEAWSLIRERANLANPIKRQFREGRPPTAMYPKHSIRIWFLRCQR